MNVTLYGSLWRARLSIASAISGAPAPLRKCWWRLARQQHRDRHRGLQYTDLSFSIKAGGGVDFNLTPHFAIRVIDADTTAHRSSRPPKQHCYPPAS